MLPGGPVQHMGLPYRSARLGIDFWAPSRVYKYGLWVMVYSTVGFKKRRVALAVEKNVAFWLIMIQNSKYATTCVPWLLRELAHVQIQVIQEQNYRGGPITDFKKLT
jgi:hypothetical protein